MTPEQKASLKHIADTGTCDGLECRSCGFGDHRGGACNMRKIACSMALLAEKPPREAWVPKNNERCAYYNGKGRHVVRITCRQMFNDTYGCFDVKSGTYHIVHIKQLRRLRKTKKKERREWWVCLKKSCRCLTSSGPRTCGDTECIKVREVSETRGKGGKV